MGRIIPYIMENKKCSKPPTSIDIPLEYLWLQKNNPQLQLSFQTGTGWPFIGGAGLPVPDWNGKLPGNTSRISKKTSGKLT